MKEYWGVRDGSSGKRGLGGPTAHLKDVAEAIGESERTTRRLITMKLKVYYVRRTLYTT